MFVYKVLDEMMSRQMYGLAEQAGRELRGDMRCEAPEEEEQEEEEEDEGGSDDDDDDDNDE